MFAFALEPSCHGLNLKCFQMLCIVDKEKPHAPGRSGHKCCITQHLARTSKAAKCRFLVSPDKPLGVIRFRIPAVRKGMLLRCSQ
jgi:hypothetical protein